MRRVGITLSHEETVFEDKRIQRSGGDLNRVPVEYHDYRDLPREKGSLVWRWLRCGV
jgi:hypothetical protein